MIFFLKFYQVNYISAFMYFVGLKLSKSAYQNIIFLLLNQNICCGYSKEPSQ